LLHAEDIRQALKYAVGDECIALRSKYDIEQGVFEEEYYDATDYRCYDRAYDTAS
jgi:hypothetical protein